MHRWHILTKDLEPPSPSKGCLCSQEVPLAAGAASVHPHGWERDHSVQSSGCSQALGVWLQMEYSLTNSLEKSLPGAFP